MLATLSGGPRPRCPCATRRGSLHWQTLAASLSLLLLLLSTLSVNASLFKHQLPTIGYYEHIEEPQIRVLSQASPLARRSFHKRRTMNNLQPDDTFHMQIKAFNQTFTLLLEPNRNLIHPNAMVRVKQADGSYKESSLLAKGDAVYRGYVLSSGSPHNAWLDGEAVSGLRTRNDFSFDDSLSGARVVLFRDAHNNIGLDGNFYYRGETYNLKHTEAYRSSRRAEDPVLYARESLPESLRTSRTIIYRVSDMVPVAYNGAQQQTRYRVRDGKSSEPALQSAPATTCNAHRLPYNRVNHTRDTFMQGSASGIRGDYHSLMYREASHDDASRYWAHGFRFSRRDNSFDQSQAALESGCTTSKKVLYMGVAADCTYITNYGSEDGARSQILSNWNQVSAVYERQVNVQIGIIELQIESMSCPNSPGSDTAWNQQCSDTYTIERRLSDFSSWRAKRSNDDAGLWHLMTACASGPEVGLAWRSVLCLSTSARGDGNAVSSGTAVSATIPQEWKVVAHEIGHNFGAIHDCTKDNCNGKNGGTTDCCQCDSCNCDGKYIMNPSNPVSTDDFSVCSVRAICNGIKQSGSSCLHDPGERTTLSTAMCGNGIKEGDEECDCGTGDECDNDPCCDSKTCKLKNGAKCSDFNDLCCSNCQMRSKGTVCRPKVSECDVEETCDGVSGDCPSDKHVENGEPCSGSGNSTASTKNSNLRCASGQCTNRDLQCEARGASIGATKHCSLSWNTDPCNFQCQSPDSGLACMYMSGSFIDGTECGWHAKCANGKCKGDNAFYQFVNLYRNNMPIAIPVTIIVVVILFALVSGILNFFCGCCRVCAFGRLRRRGGGGGGIIGGRKSRRMQRLQSDIPLGVYPPAPAPQQQPVQSHPHMPVAVQDQQPLYGAPGAHGYPPPPPYNSNNAMPASWVDPTPYNGPHQQPYHNH